ncbi:NAD(P)H-dependent oxidoreductase [Leuconostoc suionicum]|nr:NAD(P)H-dependent oxidoreductase [Leuconostoc suionicum]MDI6498923.1 NAD(P)H-dependent oxidoreductase [Leuconostoc suionicum]MDI6501040.1 NAD(P)H-dependent oxidoreductase [Leuconostoc suionicum]MDI6503110.1 NAD(P)H-dependent oxidoreductase [Leuconostoc suionicum]MDI6614750.1 NAD(P)H-dependent oxidoreductase [Leuconostoc suionicum]MDI6665982.1 NAD(P)H-dependent oxidoreductase [Leuconostoc suionicum]
MKTLLLNAHPDNNNPNYFTFALKEEFLKHYNLMFPQNEIDVLNLYDEKYRHFPRQN